MPPPFVVLTTGVGEDASTPEEIGMFTCSEEIHINHLEVSDAQRTGRVGRDADSLTLPLGYSSAPSSTWRMPDAERLKVCLAAMELCFDGDIPGLSDAGPAETDLVIGDTDGLVAFQRRSGILSD